MIGAAMKATLTQVSTALSRNDCDRNAAAQGCKEPIMGKLPHGLVAASKPLGADDANERVYPVSARAYISGNGLIKGRVLFLSA
jgi:hypothetical protein